MSAKRAIEFNTVTLTPTRRRFETDGVSSGRSGELMVEGVVDGGMNSEEFLG
jgi:hypothetical protein